MSTLVIRRGNSLEAFLSSSVPDLELDCAAIGIECPDLEVHTDGREETTLFTLLPLAEDVV